MTYEEYPSNLFNKIFINNVQQTTCIDPNLVLDNFKDMSKDLICSVCYFIPLNPYICSKCEKIICKECYEIYKKCPFRCKYSTFSPINNRILKNLMEKIEFKCINKKCNNIILYKDYKNHILFNCEYSEYECKLCKNFKGIKNECFLHFNECGLNEIYCKFCNNKIKNYLLEEHMRKCENEKTNCKYCYKLYLRKDLEFHENFECDDFLLLCNKCNSNYKRKEIHNNEKCLINQVNNLKLKLKEVENEKEKLKNENKKLNIKVKKLMEEKKKLRLNSDEDDFDDNNYEKKFFKISENNIDNKSNKFYKFKSNNKRNNNENKGKEIIIQI